MHTFMIIKMGMFLLDELLKKKKEKKIRKL